MTTSAQLSGAKASRPRDWRGGFGNLLRGTWRGPQFAGLAPVGDRLVQGNPDVARDIYRGTFEFAGSRIASPPAEIFNCQPPSAAWWEELTSFEWLAHFEAAGLALYRPFVRNLLDLFAAQPRRGSLAADSRRLAALAYHARFLLAGASAEWTQAFFAQVSKDARLLAARRPADAFEQMQQVSAGLAAALALTAAPALRDEKLAQLSALAGVLIDADGASLDRNPSRLLQLVADLTRLRSTLQSQHLAVPANIGSAIQRGLAMLRFMSPDDARLAVFQGTDHAAPPLLNAVLGGPDAASSPVPAGMRAGFARLSQGTTLAIADAGLPVTCNGELALELYDNGQRIVGNCGLPLHPSNAWRAAAASRTAQSTLEIEGEEWPPRASARRREYPGPRAELVNSPHGTLFKGAAQIIAAGTGFSHRREVFLAAGGHDLRGEDSLALGNAGGGWPDLGFALRFHIAPGLRATLDRPGAAVTIVLPDRAVWQFSVRGGEPHLEDSIFLATGAAPEPCRQIVIRGRVGRPDRILWAFKKLAAPTAESSRVRRGF